MFLIGGKSNGMITISEERICGGCKHHVYHFSPISQDYDYITILADCINALASVIKVLTIRITIMKKKNKYCYGWAIWTNWGSGWEKESVYDKSCESYSQVKKDAKEYRIAGAQTRITNTRWLNAS